MNNQRIRIIMEDGSVMTLELMEAVAPKSVENFLQLVDEKFFDGLCFHRVIPGFMIQGGGFLQEKGGLTHKDAPRTVRGEFRSNGINNTLSHQAGVLSMARTNIKDSASSQFFICVDDAVFLDGDYAAFGRTIDEESLAHAVRISQAATISLDGHQNVPAQPVVIRTIERV